jgi:CRP/FNR family transcriptional regulator, cyclic AMP receptor protein
MAATRTELLRRVPLFSDLDDRDLEAVANSLREVTFRAGQEVTTEGGGGVGFFVIQEGEATVSVQGAERGTLRAGEYFGEVALIARTDRTATIIADTELRCLGMTSWDFRPLVESNGTIAWKLMQALARKLQAVEERPDSPG